MHIFSNLLMLTLACGQVFTCKIYGGKEAKPHSRPYMALVERTTSTGAVKHCAGFLLNEDFIMTAAHCQARNYKVYLGLHDYYDQKNVQIVSVERTFPDKDYNVTKHINDIMLLKLSSKATFNDRVKPINLTETNKNNTPKLCSVSGWGRFECDSENNSPVLREINVTLIFNSECKNDNFYCSVGQSGPGEGDSGAPLVCEDGNVHGVMSQGTLPNKNGERTYLYAKISKNWID